jgi:hypothetical protein
MRAQYKIRSPHLTNVPEAFNYSPRITTSLQTDRKTDTRSRCRLYIDRAKDWVEWTLEQPPRVKNSVLPRYARQQLLQYTEKFT